MTTNSQTKEIGPNGISTEGSNLTEQIYCIMTGCYYPTSGTFGEFWKKQVLEEFIQNSGMPLGYRTIKDACNFNEVGRDGVNYGEIRLRETLDKLIKEGYIKKIESPANFLFPGSDGDGYELIMDATDAETEAQTRHAEEEAARQVAAANAAASQVAQPSEETKSEALARHFGADRVINIELQTL